jgi:ABC-type cobalamin/Fe3+-siderophores transport system ATPase subunit
MEETMRVIALTAENFKRLKAVHLSPGSGLVEITGRNGAGKSSVLDAIAAALGGKDAVPSKPVRDGAESARVVVDLGDIIVTRKFTGGRTTLVVESRDGLKHPSPQSVLDAVVGPLSFDPLAFARQTSKQQAQTLRELVPGLDTTALDNERKAAFDKRTDVNRDVKALQAQLEAMPIVNAPDEEASIADLARQHRAASEKAAAHARAQQKQAEHERAVEAATAALAEAERAVRTCRERLAAAEKLRDDHRAVVVSAQTPAGELDAIAARMEQAEKVNEAVRAKKARVAKAAELAKREEVAAALTAKIKEVDERKAAALAAAKLPVPGLAVDGDAVTLNGVPFEQASSAEQLRAGLAIGAALNPTLRVVLVRDGSLLDSEGLRLVADWAEANNMQVLIERVTDGGNGAGIVIEDGEVVADLATPGLALVPPPAEPGEQLQLDDAFPEPGV